MKNYPVVCLLAIGISLGFVGTRAYDLWKPRSGLEIVRWSGESETGIIVVAGSQGLLITAPQRFTTVLDYHKDEDWTSVTFAPDYSGDSTLCGVGAKCQPIPAR